MTPRDATAGGVASGHDQAAPAELGIDDDPWETETRDGFDERDLADPECDVRRVIAALHSRDGDPALGDVAWGMFAHAYGWATDVPLLLRQLSNPDPEAAAAALSTLWNNLRHQGNTSSAGALAVPFLIRTAADASVHHRGSMLDLAAELARRNHFGYDSRTDLLQADDRECYDNFGYPGRWSLQAGRDALAADAPILLALLDDPDPDVRCAAAYGLAAASSDALRIARGLRARLQTEPEPHVRISLILAIAQIAREHGDPTAARDWAHALWSDPAEGPDVRLGAAIAWLCLTDAPAPVALLDLLGQAATPQLAAAMRQVPWPDDIDEHGGLAAWLVRLLDDAPEPRTALTRRLRTSPDPATRLSAIRAGWEIAAQWRPPTDEIMAGLADQLTDPDPTVALVAARYLGRVGAAARPVAHKLAAAISDNDDEVTAWMAVALAHCGDRRAVAPLVRLLGQGYCPWPTPARWGHDIHLPERILDALGPDAAKLLPVVTERLTTGSDAWTEITRDLVRGLGTWGPDAADAARPISSVLLHRPVDTDTVVTTLGRIGPAAAFAAPMLDQLAARDDDHTPLAVWARWRVTGANPDATAAELARHTGTPHRGPQALRLLADLGTAAANSVDTITPLLDHPDSWTRIQAAHALWRSTGNLERALPVLLHETLHADDLNRLWPVGLTALRYLGEIGPPATAAIPALEAVLHRDRRVGGTGDHRSSHDEISWDEHCQQVAATALARIDPTRGGPNAPSHDESTRHHDTASPLAKDRN